MLATTISFHQLFIYLLPVIVFFVLGLSMAWFIYEAWQEQAFLEALINQLNKEKNLIKQKKTFIELCSHYLRTPLTVIKGSVELMSPLGVNQATIERTKDISNKLELSVQKLTSEIETAPAVTNKSGSAQLIAPRQKTVTNSTNYLVGSVLGAFVSISLAVYLLLNLDASDVKLSTVLIEIGLAFFVSVLVYTVRRTRSNREEVKEYFKQLILQNRTLEKQRDELVNSSLNELRQPLNDLHGILNQIDNPKLSHYINDAVNDFGDVLRKFYIMASLRSGAMNKVRQEFMLDELVARIKQRHNQKITQKSLAIETNLKKVDKLNQDPLLLEFVLETIFDNAIEYSPPAGKIEIISKIEKKKAVILIKDSGAGISKDKQILLFKPFSRADDVVNNYQHEGIGLSLYLDNLIVQYLGGYMAAESQPGKGTTIKLSLPI
ncbi:MAG TPA: ATP-binding protein [Candidatus Babeliales bacterium]|nr:ATP-binding protein [Candidatus Babeliales bacterium]